MGRFDIEPLPSRSGFVTVEITETFDNHLEGEVLYMEEAKANELKDKASKDKDKLEIIRSFKPKDEKK